MTWRSASLYSGLLALVLLACPACSDRRPVLYPVHGKVLFDGRPAPGALVVFHPVRGDPKVPKPSGTVRGDGTFSLGTFAPDDGAPPGDYRVAIVWPVAPSPAGSQKADIPNRLPARYGNPQTSPLHAQIKDGPTELEPFKLVK